MKVAIIHYWLVNMRGGEKVLEALLDVFPHADIYTHVIVPEKISDKINQCVVGTTFIQKLPKAQQYYQSYLPLMPIALEQLDLRGYDLIISSESGPAKGVITSPDALHICYCHSPMRYVWDMYHDYKEQASFIKRCLMPVIMHRIRLWDLASSFRVDYFIANSSFIQQRIRKYYHRDSDIIHPPIVVDDFYLSDAVGDFYLMVGQLVAYKNTRLAVEAFNQSGKKLIIIGAGDELEALKLLAKKNIVLLGYQDFEVIKQHYSRCKALIFPGVEDFGMVPIEAMASGRPVIALRKGGAIDTVLENITGLFFNEPSLEALNQAVEQFERQIDRFEPAVIQAHARQYDKSIFIQKIKHFVQRKAEALDIAIDS